MTVLADHRRRILFDNGYRHRRRSHFQPPQGGWFDIEIRILNNRRLGRSTPAFRPGGGGHLSPANTCQHRQPLPVRHSRPDQNQYVLPWHLHRDLYRFGLPGQHLHRRPHHPHPAGHTTPYLILHGEGVTIEAGTLADYTDPRL